MTACWKWVGEGVEVRSGEELEEDVIMKDVDKGIREEVVADDEVDDGDDENGKGGVV